MASNKVSCKEQAWIETRIYRFKKINKKNYKKSKSAYVFLVFIEILLSIEILFIKKYTHML